MGVFEQKDRKQIEQRGSDMKTVEGQLRIFKEGVPYLQIARAATPGDGLSQLTREAQEECIRYYEEHLEQVKVQKFIPASGAASRMFKELFAFLEEYDGSTAAYEALLKDPAQANIYKFFKELDRFAFYETLRAQFEQEPLQLEELLLKQGYKEILQKLLGQEGMNYGNLPKGLLEFHRYGDSSRTPIEEHLIEAPAYTSSKEGKVYLHFTVSPEHRELFRQLLEQVRPQFEKESGNRFQVTFSEQKSGTDTIAVNPDNTPFRNPDGSLLFRPAGHGALIENLNEQEAEVIFLKNIDNVLPDRIKPEATRWSKILGGTLLQHKHQIDRYLQALEKPEELSPALHEEIAHYLQKQLCIEAPAGLQEQSREEQIVWMASKLNRPLRVCGMVKNEGEAGGGPFWVRHHDGTTDLQIVESAQINLKDPQEKAKQQSLTHFNPVNLVVATHDYKGRKHDLKQFVDYDTVFITNKSKDGKELKALELPGLWNGSMADWNTVFVEVPLVTFSPVKTVNDLLRDLHQNT